MVRTTPRTVKTKTSKRVSTVKVLKSASKSASTVKVPKTSNANTLVEKKLRRGSRTTTRRGRGSASTKAVALRVSGPTAQNTGNIVRNTLAATRQRVSPINLGIRDTSPLD